MAIKGCRIAFLLVIMLMPFLLTTCSKENEALELVKLSLFNKDSEDQQTVAEWAQTKAEEGAKKNIQYKWDVILDEKHKRYVVSYVDTVDERGRFWEVDLTNKIVRSISGSRQLSRKYELSPMRYDGMFKLENITKEDIYLSKDTWNNGIAYRISAELVNNTDRRITAANAFAELVVIYSEEKAIEERGFDILLNSSISSNNPWKPGEARKIRIETAPYDKVYLDYQPQDSFCYIYLKAEDPIGFEYVGAISERNTLEMIRKIAR